MVARIAFASLFALFAFALALAARAETATGGVYVTSLPAAVDVWVDGVYVGRSPALVDGLARGRHSVTLTKSGWTVQEVDVEVSAGAIAMSSVRLAPKPRLAGARGTGTIVLRDIPARAAVSIDGLRFGGDVQKPILLVAGQHRITLETARAPRSRTVTVLPETATYIVMRDEPGESRAGVVAPSDAYLPAGSVTLEGRKIVVRYAGHVVVAHLGDPSVRYDGVATTFESAPEQIGRKLYLPLELLERLAAATPRPEPSR